MTVVFNSHLPGLEIREDGCNRVFNVCLLNTPNHIENSKFELNVNRFLRVRFVQSKLKVFNVF